MQCIEAINEVHEEHRSAINSGDVDRAIAVFTDDAVLMSPDQPVAVGKDAIQS